MIKLNEKNLKYTETPLPTKAERKAEKLEQDVAQKNKEVMMKICEEFINDKIAPLDIPLYQVEEHIPILIKSLFGIIKSHSTSFAEYLKAKSKLEDTTMLNLEENEELK